MKIARIAPLLFLGFAVACGGTSFSTGLSGSKKISELDDADATAICDAAEAAAKDFASDKKDGFCKLTGAASGALAGALGLDAATACQAAVDECLAKDPTPAGGQCMPKVADCDATVEELESCFNDSLDVTGDVLDDLASKECAALVTDVGAIEVTSPATCTSLAQKCPTLSFGAFSVDTSTST